MNLSVVKLGGSQHLVTPGSVIQTNRLSFEVGQKFSEKCVVCSLGNDNVDFNKDAVAEFTVLEHKKGNKIIVFKKKRRKNHRKRNGFSASLTVVRFDGIVS